jgi:hypothetical protein
MKKQNLRSTDRSGLKQYEGGREALEYAASMAFLKPRSTTGAKSTTAWIQRTYGN